MMLQDQPGDWDSALEETRSQVNSSICSQIKQDYRKILAGLPSGMDRILVKQCFAMQHKVRPELLETEKK